MLVLKTGNVGVASTAGLHEVSASLLLVKSRLLAEVWDPFGVDYGADFGFLSTRWRLFRDHLPVAHCHFKV